MKKKKLRIERETVRQRAAIDVARANGGMPPGPGSVNDNCPSDIPYNTCWCGPPPPPPVTRADACGTFGCPGTTQG